jgi:hypothetical protein
MEPEGSLLCYKSPPLVHIMSQMDPVHTSFCFVKIQAVSGDEYKLWISISCNIPQPRVTSKINKHLFNALLALL